MSWLLAIAFLIPMVRGFAQTPDSSAKKLQRDRIYTYLLKDGSCEFGEMVAATSQSLTVRRYNKPDLTLLLEKVIQIAQGNEIFYSSRSSWSDVQAAKIYSRETMMVVLKNGTTLTGKPKTVTADTLLLEQTFSTSTIKKQDVKSVLTLKLRPETASFGFVQEEAGFFQIFYPEFYQRVFGLEGRLPVRLYDLTLVESDTPSIAACYPKRTVAGASAP